MDAGLWQGRREQMPLENAGPSGADKGEGAKYLLLPPGYVDPIPEGYIPLQSDTYGGHALLRSNLVSHSDADVEKAAGPTASASGLRFVEAAHPAGPLTEGHEGGSSVQRQLIEDSLGHGSSAVLGR